MKVIIFFLVTISLTFSDVKAQEQAFRRFEKKTDLFGRRYLWLLPTDLEQKFDSLRREALEKDFELGLEPLRESLLLWLAGQKITLDCQQGVENPFPEAWWEAIPSGLTKRIEEHEAKQEFPVRECFTVYVLVNNKGDALSVYFRIDPFLQGVIREKELQVMHDAIVKERFNPTNFKFSRLDKKLVKEALAKMTDRELNMSAGERGAMIRDVESRTKPCVYGVVEFFTMKYLGKNK